MTLAGGAGASAIAAALGYGVMVGGGGGGIDEEDPDALIHRGLGQDIEVKLPSDLKQRCIINSPPSLSLFSPLPLTLFIT